MNTTLAVIPRTEKAAVLRAAGKIPAVVYGPKQAPVSIAVDKMAVEKLIREVGESTIVSLSGLDHEIEVLIHDAAFDAAKGGVSHVDFYAIERGKELTTNVPLEFIGVAPIEKTGAMITKVLHDVEVTCRPSDLPSKIEVDLSVLTAEGQHIVVSDLNIPKGVTIETAAEEVVVTVSGARTESEGDSSEAPDMSAIEVEAKGKQTEEAEA